MVAVAAACALAGLADQQPWAPVPRFAIATLALIGLAWIVTFATEQVGGHLGAAVTGVLQATLANLPELFVIVFALNAGEVLVAQTAIVGSLLANALLLLGIVIVVGARRAPGGVMRFSKRLPNDTVTLLLALVFAIVFTSPALGLTPGGGHTQTISVIAAALLLGVYAAWLLPYLRGGNGTHGERPPGREPGAAAPHGVARLTLPAAMLLLIVSGVGSAFVSEWFVAALRPAITVLHISKPFAGLVIVAIAGNAVEHAASVVLAARGSYDLAISVVKSSVAQIAGFLYPVLVIVSLALAAQLTFALAPVYIGALALMSIVVWQVSGDGEASAFEGWALIALYVIVAVVAAYQ